MIDFEYYNPAKIIFGEHSEQKLKSLLAAHNVKSLQLVYSGDFIKRLGIYDVIKEAVAELGIRFSENGNVVPNPSIDLVRELVKQGKANGVDFVLAVGGGSSIDTAKAVALGIPYDGDVWDFFEKGVSPKQVLPIGVIATTASSGSETSNAAILSSGEWKLGFEDDRIIPKFAIMNPKYTVGLPAYQTFVGIADVLSHLLERYFSDEKNSDTTDYLIEGVAARTGVLTESSMNFRRSTTSLTAKAWPLSPSLGPSTWPRKSLGGSRFWQVGFSEPIPTTTTKRNELTFCLKNLQNSSRSCTSPQPWQNSRSTTRILTPWPQEQ